MKPTYPINYRGGWMQPAVEYVPEVMLITVISMNSIYGYSFMAVPRSL